MTPAQQIMAMVEANSARTKRPISRVWDTLYTELEYSQDFNVRRVAYVSGITNLEAVEEEGLMPALVKLATDFLGEKPALPEQKKTPLQGSLMEDNEHDSAQ
jgi:hypothetical protein